MLRFFFSEMIRTSSSSNPTESSTKDQKLSTKEQDVSFDRHQKIKKYLICLGRAREIPNNG